MNWTSHFGLKGEGYGRLGCVSPRKLVLVEQRLSFLIRLVVLKVRAEWKRSEETLLCAPISKKTSFQIEPSSQPSLYLTTMATMTAGNVTRRQPEESVLADTRDN